MSRLRRRLGYWLKRGSTVPSSRYAGRCQYLLKYEQGLWVFLNHAGIPLDGAADHGVSEALYLRDPDQNGVELYRDRPKQEWPRSPDGGVAMYTRPLDLEALLRELATKTHKADHL